MAGTLIVAIVHTSPPPVEVSPEYVVPPETTNVSAKSGSGDDRVMVVFV